MNTRWIINKNIDKQIVSDLSNALSIDENLATLLVQRGITNYDEAKDFQEGVARVKQNDKYGLIDKFGSFIIECEYDYISEFGADGLAFSRRNGCDVYLDKEGTPWAKVKGNLVRVNF